MRESIDVLERWGERSCSFLPQESAQVPLTHTTSVYISSGGSAGTHALSRACSRAGIKSALSDVARGTAGPRYVRQSGSERCLLPAMALCHAQRFPGRLESNWKQHRGPLSRCDKALHGYPPQATQSPMEIGSHPYFFQQTSRSSRVTWGSLRVVSRIP